MIAFARRSCPFRNRCKSIRASLAALLLALAGCDTGSTACETAGELQPVLTIRAVLSTDGQPTSDMHLTLSNIRVDGGTRNVQSIPTFTNAQVVNDRIECDVPCGFGVEQGTWSFTVQADGFQDKQEERKAFYRTKETECGPMVDGTRLDVTLQPA